MAREDRVKYISEVEDQKDYWIDYKAALKYIFYFRKTGQVFMIDSMDLQNAFRENMEQFKITPTADGKNRALAIIGVQELSGLINVIVLNPEDKL